MVDRKPIKLEYSAGGVVFKRIKEPFNSVQGKRKYKGVEVLWLIIQPNDQDQPWREGSWQFPKGWIEGRETGQQAAVREVEEEGGIKAGIIDKIGRIDIFFYNEEKQKVIKNIVFFLMEYLSGSEKDHDRETKEAVWLPYDQAHEHLTFKSEKEILEKARKILEEEEKQPSLL